MEALMEPAADPSAPFVPGRVPASPGVSQPGVRLQRGGPGPLNPSLRQLESNSLVAMGSHLTQFFS